jgi:hypothetical protein
VVITKRDGREVGFKVGSKFKLRVRFTLSLMYGLELRKVLGKV